MRGDGIFRARWAGGWAATRVLFGLAVVDAQIARFQDVRGALVTPKLVFASGPTRITSHVMLSATEAWALWGLAFVPLAAVLWGGRSTKPAITVWLVAHLGLLMTMGLNVRAPERFLVWMVVGLLLAPVGERALATKLRSPAPRWYFVVLMSALYGSTGWLKLVVEPAWRSGDALRFDLVERFHSGGALATWLSAHPALCVAMSWFTLIFEASFPFLIGWAAATPWLLVAGAMMHLGIGTLMDVGPLGTLAMSTYPALCDPDRARGIAEKIDRLARRWWPGR